MSTGRVAVYGLIATCGLLLTVVVVMAIARPGSGGELAAQDVARDAVRLKLKVPAAADFVSEKCDRSGGGYYCFGIVDAQNSFGAKLRKRYIVKLSRDAAGAWVSDSVLIVD